jgi:hypothetical protein
LKSGGEEVGAQQNEYEMVVLYSFVITTTESQGHKMLFATTVQNLFQPKQWHRRRKNCTPKMWYDYRTEGNFLQKVKHGLRFLHIRLLHIALSVKKDAEAHDEE